MPKLLTVAAVEKLRPRPNKRREVRDGGAPGLHLVIQPSGYNSWVLRGRRPDGRQGKVTLGPLDLSRTTKASRPSARPCRLRAACVLANQLLRQRAKGVDITEPKIALPGSAAAPHLPGRRRGVHRGSRPTEQPRLARHGAVFLALAI